MQFTTIAAALATSNGAIEEEALKAVSLGTVSLAILALCLVTVVLKAALIAGSVWIEVSWPRLAARALEDYQARPWRCYIVGGVNATVGTLLTLLLLVSGVLTLPGLFAAALLIFLMVLGFSTAYRVAARRLHPEETDTLQTLVLGGVLVELTALIPFLGQVYHLNLLLRGLGAATLALLRHRRAQKHDDG